MYSDTVEGYMPRDIDSSDFFCNILILDSSACTFCESNAIASLEPYDTTEI